MSCTFPAAIIRLRRGVGAVIFTLMIFGSGGCVSNLWRTNNFSDEKLYPTPDAAAATADESRILAFLPTIGFKRDTPPTGGQPVTEAVFMRSDSDHFHQTVTVRMLGRID
jgi:hypothetical protein